GAHAAARPDRLRPRRRLAARRRVPARRLPRARIARPASSELVVRLVTDARNTGMPASAGKDAGPKVALRAIERPRTPRAPTASRRLADGSPLVGDRRPAFRVDCCETGHWAVAVCEPAASVPGRAGTPASCRRGRAVLRSSLGVAGCAAAAV